MRDLVAELCGGGGAYGDAYGDAWGEAEVRPGPGETGWEVVLGEVRALRSAPRAHVPLLGRAAPLGADSESILRGMGMLIRRAEIGGESRAVRIADGRIAALAPALEPEPGERVLDAAGGALIPGLHDHHIHLWSLAAARASAPCGPPHCTDSRSLAQALASASKLDGWIRGVGYHDSVRGLWTGMRSTRGCRTCPYGCSTEAGPSGS